MSPILKSAFAALILSAILSPAAFAQATVEATSVSIAFGDLDMSAPADAKVLLRRIQSAASSVCDQTVPRSPLAPRALTLCRRDTVKQAVHDLGISTLSAAWAGEPGTRLASR